MFGRSMFLRSPRAARVVIAVAVLVAAVTVAAELADSEYVYVEKLAHPFVGAGVVAVVVLLLGGVAFTNYAFRITVRAVAGCLAMWVGGVAAIGFLLPRTPEGEPWRTVARSSEFAVVLYSRPSDSDNFWTLEILAGRGLTRRQTHGVVACLDSPDAIMDIRFTGRNELFLRLNDGSTGVIVFDPDTLEADRPFGCG